MYQYYFHIEITNRNIRNHTIHNRTSKRACFKFGQVKYTYAIVMLIKVRNIRNRNLPVFFFSVVIVISLGTEKNDVILLIRYSLSLKSPLDFSFILNNEEDDSNIYLIIIFRRNTLNIKKNHHELFGV